MRGKREVRYVVCRLEDPRQPEGRRQAIACYPYLDLAKKEADRHGPDARVDAEGGTYSSDGMRTRQTRWQTDWTNHNIYQGREKKRHVPEVYD